MWTALRSCVFSHCCGAFGFFSWINPLFDELPKRLFLSNSTSWGPIWDPEKNELWRLLNSKQTSFGYYWAISLLLGLEALGEFSPGSEQTFSIWCSTDFIWEFKEKNKTKTVCVCECIRDLFVCLCCLRTHCSTSAWILQKTICPLRHRLAFAFIPFGDRIISNEIDQSSPVLLCRLTQKVRRVPAYFPETGF